MALHADRTVKTTIPVHRLPNETLETIFDFACWGDHVLNIMGKARLPAEVAISHVCRRWRIVSLQFAPLWTVLTFQEMPPFTKTRAYLERSKSQPLVINVEMTSWKGQGPKPEELEPGDDISTHIPVYYPSFVHRAFQFLSPHVHRWKTFGLITLDPALMRLALYYLSKLDGAPILESINLAIARPDARGIDEISEDPWKVTPFKGNQPCLKRVHLLATPIEWSGPLFTNLEVYDIASMRPGSGPAFEDLLHTFNTSSQLKQLSFRGASPQVEDDDDWPEDKTIKLEELETLVLELADPCHTRDLLDRLYLPNICHLRLTLGKPFVGNPDDPFDLEEPFETRSRRVFTKLFLAGLCLPQWHNQTPEFSILRKIFTLQLVNASWDWPRRDKSEEGATSISRKMLKELGPCLRVLALHKASPSFVKLLTTEQSKKGLGMLRSYRKKAYCPGLKVLIVGDLGEMAISQFVRSRHQLGSPLKALIAPRSMEREVVRERLLENGFVKEIEYYDGEGDHVDFAVLVENRFVDLVKSRTVSPSSDLFYYEKFVLIHSPALMRTLSPCFLWSMTVHDRIRRAGTYGVGLS